MDVSMIQKRVLKEEQWFLSKGTNEAYRTKIGKMWTCLQRRLHQR
jgi:hypothetical protein